ncbi:hypothetical protein F383_38345 [Gossypium arboreum]|uniref:Uncharacterized protein n=1 Tax=Gossypium arboreum TaxID=29729 RepID=A0A0B0MG89_GOSAR|nr:hypothetical protein F383_38345 [Gossypium arboreum]
MCIEDLARTSNPIRV